MGAVANKLSKRSLIVFNLLFWVACLTFLCFGSWMLVEPRVSYLLDLVNLSESVPLLRLAAYLCVVVGIVGVGVGFIGCCGALKEVPCMLVTFALLLLILISGILGAGILAVVFQDKFSDAYMGEYLKNLTSQKYGRPNLWVTPLIDTVQYYVSKDDQLWSSVVHYEYGLQNLSEAAPTGNYTQLLDRIQFHATFTASQSLQRAVRETYGGAASAADRAVERAVDRLQFSFECCGARGPHDWAGSRWQTTEALSQGRAVPTSCCVQVAGATFHQQAPRSTRRCQAPLPTGAATTAPWRHSQQQCCGSASPRDYMNSWWQINLSEGAARYVPPSCCNQRQTARPPDDLQPVDPQCTVYPYDSEAARKSVHQQGCQKKLSEWLEKHAIIFMALGFGIPIFLLFGVCCACCLCRNVKEIP